MGPKNQPKKGKDDQEDLTDLPTLPSLNYATFTILHNEYFTTQIREKIQKFVQEKLSVQERIKTITREEIIAYGKAKQFILDPPQLQQLPADDPRSKMSEAECLARSAAERLFEVEVQLRRLKRDKLAKLEEEAKQQNVLDVNAHLQNAYDNEGVDIMIQFVDFPANRNEIMAFAKYSNAINCIFEVNQKPKPPPEDEEEEVEQEEVNVTQQERDYRDKVTDLLNYFKECKNVSVKNSPLRNTAIIQVDFINQQEVVEKVNEQGERVEELKEPEQVFIGNLMQSYINYYANMYVKFLLFKKRVKVVPLAPDREAQLLQQQYLAQEDEYQQWLQDQEQTLKLVGEDVEQKSQIEGTISQEKQNALERSKELAKLQERLKISLDDTREHSSLDIYEKDFISNKETQNNIGSILSAMVMQISAQNGKSHQKLETEMDETDELSDIFDLHSDMIEEMRGGEPKKRTTTSDGDMPAQSNLLAIPNSKPSEGMKLKQSDSLGRQKTVVGEIEYTEALDTARQCMYKLPKLATEDDVEKAKDIYIQEKKIFENLVIPGLNRHNMPQMSQKSERLRDQEKPQMYPFCTLPIEDVERGLKLRMFQDMIKSYGISDGFDKHPRFKAFDRHYHQYMSDDLLRQVMADVYFQEADISTMYYARDDSLLVAAYFKKTEKDSQIDHQKEWRAAYRNMPDFQSWLDYWSQEVVFVQDAQTSNNLTSQPILANPGQALTKDQQAALLQQQQMQALQIQIKPQKFILDEEMLPEQALYDIDDQRVQQVRESMQFLYPEDNSIMRRTEIQVGGRSYLKSTVYKDGFCMTMRESNVKAESEGEEEYGLFKYIPQGVNEVHFSFWGNTKMLLEHVGLKRNEQKLIRIDPPKPTPEEIQAREEAIKAAQLAASKQKGKGAQQPVVIEEYKEPEPTWEPEPWNDLDYKYSDDDIGLNRGTMVTTSYPNGLLIQHMPNGNVVQYGHKESEEEEYRVITMDGHVIRFMRNKDREVLYHNGERGYFNRQHLLWVVTNRKGMQRAKRDGIEWDLEKIPTATETDAVTGARTTIREDNVVSIQYVDGREYLQFPDGTQMMVTEKDGNRYIRIEREGYASVDVQLKQDGEADPESLYVTQRSNKVMTCYFPDGSFSQTFQDGEGYRHMFTRPDFSALIVNADGKFSAISSNSRSTLNENGSKAAIGLENDYLKELFQSDQSQLQCSVFYGKIGEFNKDGNYLATNNVAGDIICKINGEHALYKESNQPSHYYPLSDSQQPSARSLHQQQTDDGREIEDVGGFKFPLTKHFLFPRLFVIKSDGSGGYELFTKEQLEYWFRLHKNRPEGIKQKQIVMVGTTAAKSQYFVTKISNMEEAEERSLVLKDLEVPQNAEFVRARLIHKQETKGKERKMVHLPEQYLFRQIFEFPELEAFKQEAFYDDLYRFKQWKLSQVRYDTEFGIMFPPTKENPNPNYKQIEDDEYVAKRINTKIYKERRNKKAMFQPDNFKRAFLNQIGKNDEMSEYLRRTTQNFEKDFNSVYRSSGTHKNIEDASPNAQNTRTAFANIQIDNVTQENWRQKKKVNAQNKLKFYLNEVQRMMNTPSYIEKYFVSKEGQLFTKNNPEKPPSQEVLMRMSQRIDRSQQNNEKGGSQYDSASQGNQQQNMSMHQNDQDNPIVALEPEDHHHQMQMKMGKKGDESQAVPKSLYLQEKDYLKRREDEGQLKAEEYHVGKTKEYDVYGKFRQEKQFVKSIQKSNAQADLNEKFITTECIADRRVKISSMNQRQYMNAPSIEEVRKQGQHQMILNAINKKQTFPELINQANAMVTSVLHDPLKRSLNILPSKCIFGTLKAGGVYEMTLTLKNEDSLAQRITIKQVKDKHIQVSQEEYGHIAPGMLKKVKVTITTQDQEPATNVKETLQIVTKHDIFKIPIEARILPQEEYEEVNREQQVIQGQGIHNSRVREKLTQSIADSRKGDWRKNIEQFDQQVDEIRGGAKNVEEVMKTWMETTNSESKLPELPNIAGKRPFQVNPKRNLEELKKSQNDSYQ